MNLFDEEIFGGLSRTRAQMRGAACGVEPLWTVLLAQRAAAGNPALHAVQPQPQPLEDCLGNTNTFSFGGSW